MQHPALDTVDTKIQTLRFFFAQNKSGNSHSKPEILTPNRPLLPNLKQKRPFHPIGEFSSAEFSFIFRIQN